MSKLPFIQQRCKQPKVVAVKPVYSDEYGYWHKRILPIYADCGECEVCRRKKQNEWSTRLDNFVSSFYRDNPKGKVFFATFTISNEFIERNIEYFYPEVKNSRAFGEDIPLQYCVPDIDWSDTPEARSSRWDIFQHTNHAHNIYRDFFRKKIIDRIQRKRHGLGIKCVPYYVANEYGDQKERIHYHMLIGIPDMRYVHSFAENYEISPSVPYSVGYQMSYNGNRRGADYNERIMNGVFEYLWSEPKDKQNACRRGVKKLLKSDLDAIGFVTTYQASAIHCRYITKYVCKVTGDRLVDKIPFHRQSFKIGLDEDAIIDAVKNNREYYVKRKYCKEYKIAIPRYYKTKYRKMLGIYNDCVRSFCENAISFFDETRNFYSRNHIDENVIHDVPYTYVDQSTGLHYRLNLLHDSLEILEKRDATQYVDTDTGELTELQGYISSRKTYINNVLVCDDNGDDISNSSVYPNICLSEERFGLPQLDSLSQTPTPRGGADNNGSYGNPEFMETDWQNAWKVIANRRRKDKKFGLRRYRCTINGDTRIVQSTHRSDERSFLGTALHKKMLKESKEQENG